MGEVGLALLILLVEILLFGLEDYITRQRGARDQSASTPEGKSQ